MKFFQIPKDAKEFVDIYFQMLIDGKVAVKKENHMQKVKVINTQNLIRFALSETAKGYASNEFQIFYNKIVELNEIAYLGSSKRGDIYYLNYRVDDLHVTVDIDSDELEEDILEYLKLSFAEKLAKDLNNVQPMKPDIYKNAIEALKEIEKNKIKEDM